MLRRFDNVDDDNTQPTFSLESRPKPDKQNYYPVLLCVEGPHRGERFPLKFRENQIGRSSSAQIHLQDEMASRRHACITYSNVNRPDQPPQCLLEDLGSHNGTELNGQIIGHPVQLNERDRILVGACLFGFLFRDDHEMAYERLLYEMATRDALTGLGNRIVFRDHLLQHVERSTRYQRKLSLLIADIDHFKDVNDKFGHDAGDRALIHLARILESCCRRSEIIARWGGEEFAVLMPETGEEAPTVLAERIRRTLEDTPLQYGDQTIRITVSIGGTTMFAPDDADSLFKRADEQLYLAKQCGRNRVMFDGTRG